MNTLEEFFRSFESSKLIFDAVRGAINSIGPTEIRVTKSQVAFWRRKAVARVWIPGKYLHGDIAPLVLTLGFDHRIESGRWKEIVEPAPGRFTHHLELRSATEIDAQVREWLHLAWENAG